MIHSAIAAYRTASHAFAALLALSAASGGQTSPTCVPEWQPTFGGLPGVDGPVYAQTVFDDGTGPALYVGGAFAIAGATPANNVARWDGAQWSALGVGTNSDVYALAVFDDGGGPALYAGGWFTSAGGQPASNIAKWNGATWSALGAGCDDLIAAALVFDDGGGPDLYVVGPITSAGGAPVAGAARWNGTTWSAVGSELGSAGDLVAFDDGSGSSLYAAGAGLARWNGVSWQLVGAIQGEFAWASDAEVYDDGSGPAIYLAGDFIAAGTVAASGLARWKATGWSLPPGAPAGLAKQFDALHVFDDGSGPALHASSRTVISGGSLQEFIERYDGAWSTVATGDPEVPGVHRTLGSFDDGSGPELIAGGEFLRTQGLTTRNVARHASTGWVPMGDGMGEWVFALRAFDDGSGQALYVGGSFAGVGGGIANGIARWDGATWTPLGGALPVPTQTNGFIVFDDGSGPALYADSYGSNSILRWTGANWVPVGALQSAWVQDFAVHDAGAGPELHASGSIRLPGGALHSVVRWNGSAWVGLGPAFTGPPSSSGYSLASFDDGTGPALYVGGNFTHSGTTVVNGIARWNGTSWQPLGSGLSFVSGAWAAELEVYDDGNGAYLYVGGKFSSAGGVNSSNVARWSGSAWSSVAGGVWGGMSGGIGVRDLSVIDDGTGPVLVAAGTFGTAGGQTTGGVARWNGMNWSPFAGGLQDVEAISVYDSGAGPAIVLGGRFTTSPVGDSYVAAWTTPCASGEPICFGDGSGSPCPCGNNSAVGSLAGCTHSFGAAGRLVASGVARISADTLVLHGTQMTNGSALYFQGSFDPSNGAGAVFGDGLRCAQGTVRRLGAKQNVNGVSRYPSVGDAPISAAGGITAATTRLYQVWYRNVASYCTPAAFNLTNAWRTFWHL